MIEVARGRTVAIVEWLRGLRDGGFAVSLEGDVVVRGRAVQMTLVDDLEVVRVEAPVQRVPPAVVAVHRSGWPRFVVPCSSGEMAERIYAMVEESG